LLIRAIVCGSMAASRLVELRISRRNLDNSRDARPAVLSRATYPLIVALHTFAIAATFLRGGSVRWRWLMPLVLAQPLRFWAIVTLGARWNVVGAVSQSTQVEAGGPYAFVRHPNYAVIAVELFSLPAAFGRMRLACIASAANACLLALRIREEESMLFELPGYAEHFRGKARFIPGLF
jgi:methyltransferase